MTTTADIHGTLFTKFGQYDSDFVDGYKIGDVVFNGANIYVATSDILPGTVFRQADSELDSDAWLLSLETAGTLEQLKDVTMYDSDSESASNYKRIDGYALTWDSEVQKWRPREAASRISNLTDVAFTDSDSGEHLLQGGSALRYVPGRARWEPGFYGFSELTDVGTSVNAAAHGEALAWDSDLDEWVPQSITVTSFSSIQKTDVFRADSDQDRFYLSHVPNGDVIFVRNGVVLSPNAALDSDSEVQYISTANNNFPIDSDDDIWISYVYNGPATQLAKLDTIPDVDVTARSHGSVLLYDSDDNTWHSSKMLEAQFTATVGQTNFILTPPAKMVTGFYRNGLRLPVGSWNDSDGNANYVASGNQDSILDLDDIIQITYYK